MGAQPRRQFNKQRFGMRAPLVVMAVFMFGCVTYMPVDEWTIARAAYEAARDADAARYVPSIWFNAEQAYREGQKAFRERRYAAAKTLFIQARQQSEQAENAARLARQQSGEVVP
jgi:Domain of unknown function (DUF4398)